MEQFKQAYKSVIKYTEELERKNLLLIQTIKDILNEDDIKELPAYTLLYRTYSQILTGELKQQETSEKSPSEIYDPLHAPPNARGKKQSLAQRMGYETDSKTPILKSEPEFKIQTQTQNQTQIEPQVKHYSSQTLNVDVCLLTNTAQKPKVQMLKKTPQVEDIKAKAKAKPREIKIQSKPDEHIYKIEIEGIIYLKHENYLYDIATRKRVANIENNYFKFINKEKIIGEHSSIIKLNKVDGFSEYYSTEVNNGTVYILLNGSIAQSVGEFNEGEIELWA